MGLGRAAAIFTVVAAMLSAAGCTGLEPAMIGAAASGLQTGASATKWGKLNVMFNAPEDRVREAVVEAAGSLGLTVRTEKPIDRGRAMRYVLVDDLKEKYSITIRARTAHMTAMQVNVGWFGSRPAANLLLQRIRAALFGEDPNDGMG